MQAAVSFDPATAKCMPSSHRPKSRHLSDAARDRRADVWQFVATGVVFAWLVGLFIYVLKNVN
ncbi:hypothetical protein [Oleiharenicola lentus]|uniref:hypothetical protein n=1 Tax=Oleiharenicola lentus TaxID=2508720 RepID=UPI003F67FE78